MRIHILSLFKIILTDYDDKLNEYFQTNKRKEAFYSFTGEHLLPDKLLVKINCLNDKDDKYQDLIQNFDIDNDDNFDFKKSSKTDKNIGVKIKNSKILSKESMLKKSKNLIKFFNKTIYESQIDSIYKFFIDWLNNRILNDKILVTRVIDFLIILVSKISPDYIDNFSNYHVLKEQIL